jgi:hypothetical protein
MSFVGGAKAASSFIPHQASVHFDGTTEYLRDSTASLVGIADVWTVSAAWRSIASPGTERIVEITDTGSAVNLISITAASVLFQGVVNDSAGATIGNPFWFSSPGTTWHHAAITWNGGPGDLIMYVDGVNRNSVLGHAGVMTDTTRRISVGANVDGTSLFGEGYIHHVAVWNTALSAAEITEIYAGGIGIHAIDLNKNAGNYVSAANLRKWFPLGHRNGTAVGADSIGSDIAYGSNGNHDLMRNPVGIAAADVIAGQFPGV